MSSANLDLVRSIFSAWGRGDFSSHAWAHPAIEFVLDEDSPQPRKGVANMAESWRDVLSSWEQYRLEGGEYRELDDERVLVLLHVWGRGKTSGVELGQMRSQGAALFHIRDGKVTRLASYTSRARAFADLGLAPDIGS
jgi:ketosteroid isomerase-like protein